MSENKFDVGQFVLTPKGIGKITYWSQEDDDPYKYRVKSKIYSEKELKQYKIPNDSNAINFLKKRIKTLLKEEQNREVFYLEQLHNKVGQMEALKEVLKIIDREISK
jgi:hypothetical protein